MVNFKAIKENLTSEQIISILYNLGSESYKMADEDTLIFRTVCHHGDSFKLYYYSSSKTFHCYTSCSDSFDIYELIQRSKKVSFNESIQIVCNLIGLNTKHSFGESTKRTDDWEILNRYTKNVRENREVEIPTCNSNILNMFMDSYYSGWIQDGISIESMKKYNIRYDVSRNGVIIPHYNINDELIGIRKRALNQNEINSGYKYMPLKIENIEYSHPLMFNLYGLNKTKEAIQRAKKIVIFESEKSVLLCDTYYGDNNFTVAVCGSNISNWHRDLILSLGVSEVIIAFDKEFETLDSEEAKKYEQKIFRIGQKFAKYVTTWAVWDDLNLLEYKDSPCDKGKDVLEKLLKNKKEIECEE